MTRLILIILLIPLTLVSAPTRAQLGPGMLAITRAHVCETADAAAALPNGGRENCVETPLHDIDAQGREIWVRMTIDSEALPNPAGQPRAVAVSAMAASSIYWNGRLLGSNGQPGANLATEIPGLMDYTVHLPSELILDGENSLVVHMSSHHGILRARHPTHVIAIAPYGSVRTGILSYYLPAIMSAGALLLAGLYFLGLFAVERREIGPLLLSMMALFAVGQLAAESLRGLVAYPYTLHIPRLIMVGVFGGAFSITLIAFISNRFARHRQRLFLAIGALPILTLAPFAPGFDAKPLVAMLIGSLVSLLAVAAPAWRGDVSARVTAAALAGFATLVVVQNAEFLNRDFFFAVCILMGALFIDQILILRQERQARDAATRRSSQLELELLRRGIAPHFLMNTLNCLSEWIESDPKSGLKLIEALGDQMRSLATISDRDLIPLENETDLVRSYLTIMSYRSDVPFTLEVQTPTGLLQIPPGILHTLAENAFSNNHYAEGGNFILDIEATDTGHNLSFTTPPGGSSRKNESTGKGHAYIRGKLQQAYARTASFETGANPDGGWTSVISLPAGSA
jgi:hypothetical protein